MADDLHRRRVELRCPECGHSQVEPALVISTQCRACRAHFQVRDGAAVIRPRPIARWPAVADPVVVARPTRPKVVAPRPTRFQWLKTLWRPPARTRPISCFHCGHAFPVVRGAHSTQCPRCCGYVSLADHLIENDWNRSLETRGDVTIGRTGSVTCERLRCHHLHVSGKLASPVECSGRVTFSQSGRIPGGIQCRQLRIARGVKIEFLQPVEASQIEISGHVRGNLICHGTVTLARGARLQGPLRAAALIIRAGASHVGVFETLQADPHAS